MSEAIPLRDEGPFRVACENSLLRSLFNLAPLAIEIYDRWGTAVMINEAQLQLLGLSDAGPVIGRFNILSDPGTPSGLRSLFLRAFAGEAVEVDELEIPLESWDAGWQVGRKVLLVSLLLLPLRGPDGEVAHVASFLRDLTERRRMERALLHARRHEDLGLLAGGIAHDFSNLLQVATAELRLAREDLAVAPDLAAEAMGRCSEALAMTSDLTRQLLAYAGKTQLELAQEDLSQLVASSLRLLRSAAGPHVRLEADLAYDQPLMTADRVQVQQALLNLVRNAAEAIGEAGGTVLVRTRATQLGEQELLHMLRGEETRPGRFLLLQVADTGPGMDHDLLTRAFDPFFSTKPEGNGMGLSTVLGITRGHRGALAVDTAPGAGACFSLYFPCR